MDITTKINGLLGESTIPSQNKVLSTMSKGLKDVSDITNRIGMSLWHYLDTQIVGKKVGGIFKTQPSMKLIDELWDRIGKSVEKSEQLTPEALKKLKANFYSFSKTFDSVYEWNSKEKRWEFK